MRFVSISRALLVVVALLPAIALAQTRTPVASDDFSGYTPEAFPTSNWTDLDNFNGQLRVIAGGGGINNPYASNSTMRRDSGEYSADQYAEVTLATISSTTQQRLGVVLRASADTGNSADGYLCYLDDEYTGSTRDLIIARMVDADVTVLATQTSVTVADGDEISCNVTGDDPVVLNGYINSTLQTNLTNVEDDDEARITSAGRPGVYGRSDGAGYVDAWVGGNITEDTDPPVLSSATPSGTLGTTTTATIGATTDKSTGTFYAVVDDAGGITDITEAQIKAGDDSGNNDAIAACNDTVSDTSPSCDVTGLTANTSYSYAAVQSHDNGDSNIVTGTFTTDEEGSGPAIGPLNYYRRLLMR